MLEIFEQGETRYILKVCDYFFVCFFVLVLYLIPGTLFVLFCILDVGIVKIGDAAPPLPPLLFSALLLATVLNQG